MLGPLGLQRDREGTPSPMSLSTNDRLVTSELIESASQMILIEVLGYSLNFEVQTE